MQMLYIGTKTIRRVQLGRLMKFNNEVLIAGNTINREHLWQKNQKLRKYRRQNITKP